MGCSNQVGCLGPKPREREVYIDLIDKIYHEVTTITIDKKQEKYTSIKNHLLKKGLLRKLIDNLISHKANLQQCLVQNYEMAETSKNTEARTTSLVIVDKIFDQMFRQSSSKKQTNEQVNQRSSKKLQKQRQSREFTLNNTENYQNAYIITNLYMKLILFLFTNESELYKETANSLYRILSSKIEKVVWKGEIQSIFEFLISQIKKNQQIETNVELATMILNKVNENLSKGIAQQTIQFLIKKFVKEQIEVSNSKFMHILKENFRNVQGQYQILYRSIMKILDQIEFEIKKSKRISQLLNQFQLEAQGSKVFKKGLLNMLLHYLLLQFDTNQTNKTQMLNYKKQECKLNAFKLLTLWILEKNVQIEAIVQYNPSVIIRPYLLNIEKRSQHQFKNELNLQLFKIISLLKPDSVIITINKICEQFAQKDVSNRKRWFLLKLIFQLYEQKKDLIRKFTPQQLCKLIFLINIQNYYNKELKIELLQFAILSLKRMKIKEIRQNIETNNLFMMKLCQFLHSIWQEIINSIKQKDKQIHEEQSPQSKQQQQLNNFSFVCRFIKKFQSILILLKQSDLNIVLLSFICQINSYIEDNDPFQSQEEAIIFFIIQLFISKTIYLLNKNNLIPEPIRRLSKKMQQSDINKELRQDFIENAKRILKNQLNHVELGQYDVVQQASKNDQLTFFINKNKTHIQNTQTICCVSQSEMIQMDQTYKYCFCPPLKQNKKEDNQNLPSTLFKRVSSMNVDLDQQFNERMSPRNEGSESFMQIIEKIHKQ